MVTSMHHYTDYERDIMRYNSASKLRRMNMFKPGTTSHEVPRLYRFLEGRRIGRISNLLTLGGYSACKVCHTNWMFVNYHSVTTSLSGGYFDTCIRCTYDANPNFEAEDKASFEAIVKRDGPTYNIAKPREIVGISTKGPGDPSISNTISSCNEVIYGPY